MQQKRCSVKPKNQQTGLLEDDVYLTESHCDHELHGLQLR